MVSKVAKNNIVLAAIDLMPHSKHVIRYAYALAGDKQLPLLILHVAHETAETSGFYRKHAPDRGMMPILEIADNMLNDLVANTLVSTTSGTDTEHVRTLVVEGVPGPRIVEVAKREATSNIVMQSSHHNGVALWWHGSVYEYVKKNADCKVVGLPNTGEHSKITDTTSLTQYRNSMVSETLTSKTRFIY